MGSIAASPSSDHEPRPFDHAHSELQKPVILSMAPDVPAHARTFQSLFAASL
jgi:hypothetical protein